MIKILYLYYDLLNLYGEQGNILALKQSFNNQNVNVDIDYLTISDKIDFKKYDIIYLGSGSLDNLLLCLEDLKKHHKKIKNYLNSNKYLIATGSSYLLFGKYLDIDNTIYEGLNIFDYYAKKTEKMACQSFMKYNDNTLPLIGFQNRRFIVENKDNHLFSVISGHADNSKSTYEGYHYNNFIGTHLIGPLLIRNPHFTDLIVKDILDNKKLKFHEDNKTENYLAYNEYIKNFYEY